jgi:Rrf2 family cysteine metabolism transcriptional repressor
MRVSTRGRYALRAAIDLTMNARERPVLRKTLAERQGISTNYVAQILRTLRDAGIVEAVRGPGGGYRLAQDPSKVTAGDVVRTVEGSTAVVYCVTEPIDPPCPRSEGCPGRWLWKRLSEEIDHSLDGVTLEDLSNMAYRSSQGNRESGSSRT